MKKRLYNSLWFALLMLISCKDDDINVFDKTADERAAEAIAALKADLIAPANGWKVRYRPVADGGSYYVYMKFGTDNKVTIQTDLGANAGEFHTQTITYRIDSSLGLELIFETYSFFSFLFEQDAASFGGEYEFNYVNKTPDNALVFNSKTDVSTPTIIVFQAAAANESASLAKALSTKLDTFYEPVNRFTPGSSRMMYTNKDIAIYLSLDTLKRVAHFSYISSKATTAGGQALSLTTGYTLKGDSVLLESALSTVFNGNVIQLRRLYLNTLSQTTLEYCAGSPLPAPLLSGATSQGDNFVLESTLFNNRGNEFTLAADVYIGNPLNIFDENDERVDEQFTHDITGAALLVMYNNAATNNGPPINAIGVYIENADGTNSIAVRDYTATYTGNIVELTLSPTIRFIRNSNTPATVSNMNPYLDKLTQGGKTYIYKINDDFYEFYNPCSKWTFVFQVN